MAWFFNGSTKMSTWTFPLKFLTKKYKNDIKCLGTELFQWHLCMTWVLCFTFPFMSISHIGFWLHPDLILIETINKNRYHINSFCDFSLHENQIQLGSRYTYQGRISCIKWNTILGIEVHSKFYLLMHVEKVLVWKWPILVFSQHRNMTLCTNVT